MKHDTIKKLADDEAKEDFHRLIDAKLEACYMELDALRAVFSLSGEHSERLLLSRLFVFTAEVAHESGEERDEFTDAMGAAFDVASSNTEEAELDDEDELAGEGDEDFGTNNIRSGP